MFSGLIAFGQSIWSFVTPESLFYVFGSTLIGLVIGALPGLTATMGLALMTTLTLIAGMIPLVAGFGYLNEGEDPAAWQPDAVIGRPDELLDWLGLRA
mgnify:CR=1 FL=1